MDRLVLWKFFCVFMTGGCLVFSSHVSTYTLDSTGSSLFLIICLFNRSIAYRYSGIIYVFCKLWEK